jgi:hypothetical protein
LNQSSADLGIVEESRFQGFGISPFILALLRELNEHKKISTETAIDSRMAARRRAKVIVPQ